MTFVPQILTTEKMKTTVTICEDLSGESTVSLVHPYGDESWVFQYDTETKFQGMEWRMKSSPRPKNVALEIRGSKLCWLLVFKKQGVTHKEFVPEGETVNRELYVSVLEMILKRTWRARPKV
jgi:hypothetical protein